MTNITNPLGNPRVSLDNKYSTTRETASDKYHTNSLTNQLRRLDSKLRPAYIKTFYCSDIVIPQSGGKVKTTFCKQRWCIRCEKLKSARLCREYKASLSSLPDLQFVTLTLPSVPVSNLSDSVTEMTNELQRIQKRFIKRKMPIVGIRKLEISFNEQTILFSPHLHLLLSGSAIAKTLMGEWLKAFPQSNRSAQDIQPAVFSPGLFGYMTKPVANLTMYPSALDAIFTTVRGRRTIQAMGISKSITAHTPAETVEVEEGIWKWHKTDWVNESTGELLTGHTPESTHQKPEKPAPKKPVIKLKPRGPVKRISNLIPWRYPQAIRQASPIPRRCPSQLTNGPPLAKGKQNTATVGKSVAPT